MLTDEDTEILELLNLHGLRDLEIIKQWISHTAKITNIWLDGDCGDIDSDAIVEFSNWWNGDLPTQ